MDQHKLTLWILWGSMLMSLVIYGVMPIALADTEAMGAESAATLAPILAVFAVGMAAASFALRKLLLDRPMAEGKIDPKTPAGAQRIQTGFIIAWVLSEAVGIFGLVLWFLGHDGTHLYGFLLAATALLALHAPIAARTTPPATLADLAQGRGKIG